MLSGHDRDRIGVCLTLIAVAAERPPRRQPSTSSTTSLAKSPELRSARVAEAREDRPETAVLLPGQLGEGEPEVAVGVGPELQCPEAGAG